MTYQRTIYGGTGSGSSSTTATATAIGAYDAATDGVVYDASYIDASNNVRTMTDGVTTSGSPTVTSATLDCTSADVGSLIVGSGIPYPSYIGVRNSTTSIGLSSVPHTNTPVNATATASSVTLTVTRGAFVASGSTDLVASGPDFSFTSADNGKTVCLRISDQYTDGSCTHNATADQIGSATAFNDSRYLGYYVLASNATDSLGVYGYVHAINTGTQTATIYDSTNTTPITLSLTTRAAGLVQIILVGWHMTTIATGGSNSTGSDSRRATLTAAPTIKFQAADICWGTDNRVNMGTAMVNASTAKKALYLSGRALCVLSTTNPWVHDAQVNHWEMIGVDNRTAELVLGWNDTAHPSVNGAGILRNQTRNSRVALRDFSLRGFLPRSLSTTTGTIAPTCAYVASTGNIGSELILTNIRGYDVGSLSYMGSGSGNGYRRHRLENCEAIHWDNGTATFLQEATDGTDSWLSIYRSRFTAKPLYTVFNGSQFAGVHGAYTHANCPIFTDDVEFVSNQGSATIGAGNNAMNVNSGDNLLQKVRTSLIRNCRFLGTWQIALVLNTPVLTSHLVDSVNTNVGAVIEGCHFETVPSYYIQVSKRSFVIQNNRFVTVGGAAQSAISGTGTVAPDTEVVIRDNIFDVNANSGQAIITVANSGSRWVIENNQIRMAQASNFITAGGAGLGGLIVKGNRIFGMQGNGGGFVALDPCLGAAGAQIVDNSIFGHGGNWITHNNSLPTGGGLAGQIPIEISRNRFRQVKGKAIHLNAGLYHVFGADNVFPFQRTPTDGVTTNASPTVTSATAQFDAQSVGMPIAGTNIPASSFIGIVNSATSIGLSSSQTTNTPVNATASGSGITLTIGTDPTTIGPDVGSTSHAMSISPRAALNPTAVVVDGSNRLILDPNYDIHHLTGSATAISHIYVLTTNQVNNQAFGGRWTLINDTATAQVFNDNVGVPGNIRTGTGANRTLAAGAFALFAHDAALDTWYWIG